MRQVWPNSLVGESQSTALIFETVANRQLIILKWLFPSFHVENRDWIRKYCEKAFVNHLTRVSVQCLWRKFQVITSTVSNLIILISFCRFVTSILMCLQKFNESWGTQHHHRPFVGAWPAAISCSCTTYGGSWVA